MTGRVEEEAAAHGADDASTEPASRGLLALRLGDAHFGIWLDEALEILPTPPISRLPLAHPEVAGVTSVRGEVVPVLDLGQRLLDAPARRPGILVLVRGGEAGTVLGLLVDDVAGLLTVTEDELEAPPAAGRSALAPELIRGVVAPEDGDLVTILDLERATAPPGVDTNEDDAP